MNDDPYITLVQSLVTFALYAPEKCAMYGIRAVAHATASILAVLKCAVSWVNSYACMLGMKIVLVIVICLTAVRMMAIRKGSLVGTESICIMTRLMARVHAVNFKLFVSRSCTERPTMGNLATSPLVRDVPRSKCTSNISTKSNKIDTVRAGALASAVGANDSSLCLFSHEDKMVHFAGSVPR